MLINMNMTRFFTFVISLLISQIVFSQSQHMRVHQKNGEILTFNVDDLDSVTFWQKPVVDPNSLYCPSTATEIAKKMGLGINIGNTFEVCASWIGTDKSNETGWGSPEITKEMVKMYKDAGFSSVRIPTSWNWYASANGGKIPEFWINRIKTIVDYCFEYDMYAIVNIHWDNGWLEENVDSGSKTSVNATQKSLWLQIADAFKEYDERLIFASANEPGRDGKKDDSVLKSYHQTFVDAVRSSEGYNKSRCLIVQAMETSAEHCAKHPELIPTDIIDERMMMEFHYYPYTYTLMEEDADWGKMHFFWGEPYKNTYVNGVNRTCDWHTEKNVDSEFSAIKNTYVSKKIPVIMGEFMAMNRDKVLSGSDLQKFEESRRYYYNYLVKSAINNGIVPVLWDTPNTLFDRSEKKCLYPLALEGLLNGMNEGKYPW